MDTQLFRIIAYRTSIKETNWYSLYDLYIIDIMLPDGSGTELLKKIKDKIKIFLLF